MISHVHDIICRHYDIIVWNYYDDFILWYNMLTHMISYSWEIYMKSHHDMMSRFGTLCYNSFWHMISYVDIWYMISYIKYRYDIVYEFIWKHHDILCQHIKSYVDIWFHRLPRIQMCSLGCQSQSLWLGVTSNLTWTATAPRDGHCPAGPSVWPGPLWA